MPIPSGRIQRLVLYYIQEHRGTTAIEIMIFCKLKRSSVYAALKSLQKHGLIFAEWDTISDSHPFRRYEVID